MKRKILFLGTMLISILSLTSCLEGGNTTSGYDIGVLDYTSTSFTPVLLSTQGYLYSSSIDAAIIAGRMELGGCYYFHYTYDADLPENTSSMVQANGYYTVTLDECLSLPKFYSTSPLTDTSKIIAGEFPVSSASTMTPIYLGSCLFLGHTVIQPSNLELTWDLSYDYDVTQHPDDVGGKRYYDVFLRAYTPNESTQSKTEVGHLVAYSMGSFLYNAANHEKELLGSSYNQNSSVFTLRINYVSDIDANSKITWSNATADVYIYSVLGNY